MDSTTNGPRPSVNADVCAEQITSAESKPQVLKNPFLEHYRAKMQNEANKANNKAESPLNDKSCTNHPNNIFMPYSSAVLNSNNPNKYVSVWAQSSDQPCSCFEGLGSLF